EDVVSKIRVKEDLMKNPLYAQSYSVELIREKVDEGVPFREAYLEVKRILSQETNFQPEIRHSHEGSIGQLNVDEIYQKLEKVKNRFQEFDFNGAYDRLQNFRV